MHTRSNQPTHKNKNLYYFVFEFDRSFYTWPQTWKLCANLSLWAKTVVLPMQVYIWYMDNALFLQIMIWWLYHIASISHQQLSLDMEYFQHKISLLATCASPCSRCFSVSSQSPWVLTQRGAGYEEREACITEMMSAVPVSSNHPCSLSLSSHLHTFPLCLTTQAQAKVFYPDSVRHHYPTRTIDFLEHFSFQFLESLI